MYYFVSHRISSGHCIALKFSTCDASSWELKVGEIQRDISYDRQLRFQTIGAVSTRGAKWNFEVPVSHVLGFLREHSSVVRESRWDAG
jgi:hypothetical protein